MAHHNLVVSFKQMKRYRLEWRRLDRLTRSKPAERAKTASVEDQRFELGRIRIDQPDERHTVTGIQRKLFVQVVIAARR